MDQRPTAVKETEGVWLQGEAQGFLEVVTRAKAGEYERLSKDMEWAWGSAGSTWQMKPTPTLRDGTLFICADEGPESGRGLGAGAAGVVGEAGLGAC